jgi:hypothetical protein
MSFFQKDKPVVELLAREPDAPGQTLWLQSDRALKGQVRVLARVCAESVSLTFTIVAAGESYDSLDELILRLGFPKRAFLYLAELVQPVHLWPHLQVLLEPKPDPANKRAHDRQEFRLRIMSADLPGYQGVATNVSEQGTEVECSGPLSVGRAVQLKLEPDRGTVRSLEVAGIVRRCQASGKRFLVGVEFVEMTASAKVQLADIVRALQEREPGVLRHEGRIH